jgi:hypothetical protein
MFVLGVSKKATQVCITSFMLRNGIQVAWLSLDAMRKEKRFIILDVSWHDGLQVTRVSL